VYTEKGNRTEKRSFGEKNDLREKWEQGKIKHGEEQKGQSAAYTHTAYVV
jgi:hypothetical protein